MPQPTPPKSPGLDQAIDALETLIAFLRHRGEGTTAVDLGLLLARLRTGTGPDLLDDAEEESERWSSVPTRRDKP